MKPLTEEKKEEREYELDVLEKVGYLCKIKAKSEKEAIEFLKEDGCECYAIDINREIDWDDVHISEVSK